MRIIKPTKLFLFGCFVIMLEGVVFGFMMNNILKGLLMGIFGVILFAILDLISIYLKSDANVATDVTGDKNG